MITKLTFFGDSRALTALLIGLAMPAVHGGTLLFSDLTDSTNGNRAVGVAQYQSFSTGGSAFTVQDIMVVLGGNTDTTKSYSAAIYSDNGSTAPGAQFATVGTMSDSTLPGNGFATIDFSGLSIGLSAGTRYWLGLSTANASNAFWALVVPTGGDTGVSGQFYDDGTVHNTTLDAFQSQISGTVGTAGGVPEPASFLLGGVGLLTLILLRQQIKRASIARQGS